MKIKVLKTKQFTLRPFCQKDLKAVVEYANDKKIQRNLATLPSPYTKKDGQEFLAKTIDEYKKKQPRKICWAIEIDGQASGSVGLHKIVYGHRAEIGYWLARKYWGKGIMTRVVKLITQHAFSQFKLKRIFGKVYDYNPASKKVLENNGFKLEGIMRKETKKGNKYIDTFLLAKVK